jgi:hypothetical protein
VESGSSPYGKPTYTCRKQRYSLVIVNTSIQILTHDGAGIVIEKSSSMIIPSTFTVLAMVTTFYPCCWISIKRIGTMVRFRSFALVPYFIFARAVCDSAHDACAIYRLHHFWHTAPIIDLNLSNTGNRKYPDKIIISESGVPICPAGHKMVNWGYDPNNGNRIKWRCPKACGKDVKCKSAVPIPPTAVLFTPNQRMITVYSPTRSEGQKHGKTFIINVPPPNA